MKREEFIAKFRRELGCKEDSEICWCKICVTLDIIYVRKKIAKEIREAK